jgi:hypothetical protein
MGNIEFMAMLAQSILKNQYNTGCGFFEGLESFEQLKIFMDINQNQKKL